MIVVSFGATAAAADWCIVKFSIFVAQDEPLVIEAAASAELLQRLPGMLLGHGLGMLKTLVYEGGPAMHMAVQCFIPHGKLCIAY